jgi:XXXCH domain-containing protein
MVESSKQKKKKAKHKLNASQAADYLRQLADQLESGQVKFIDEDTALEGMVKVKESYKAKPGKAALKVQLKLSMPGPMTEPEPAATEAVSPANVSEDAAQAAKPEPVKADTPQEMEDYSLREMPGSYKKLKKRMSGDLKLIGKLLAAGQLPSLELARAFQADCRHMTGFPGKGDPHYERFNQSAQALYDAAKASDPDAASNALTSLKQHKKECHKEFK